MSETVMVSLIHSCLRRLIQGVFYKLGGMGDDAGHFRVAPSGSGQGVEAKEVHIELQGYLS